MIPVLAVDPSLRSTGWATITNHNGIDTHHHGTIQPRTRKAGRWHNLTGPERLAWIAAHIRQLAQQHHAQAVALEGYSYASAQGAHQLGELGGVIRTALWGAHIPHIIIPPATLKLWATGNGNADKPTMIAAANDLTPYRGNQPDEADAILLHACIADATGLPYAEPDHPRRNEALTPVITALDTIRPQLGSENTWPST